MLAACGGGANSSLPTAASAATGGTGALHAGLQSVPRSITDSYGRTMVLFYNTWTERSGQVGNELYTGTAPATGTQPLLYHNGPIQTAPKMYLVFWGSTWTSTGDPKNEKSYYTTFIQGAGGSSWLSTVTQYTQSDGQHVGNSGSIYAGTWTDTADKVPGLNTGSYGNYLAQEATRAAAHFGDYSANASYVILLAHGVKVYQFAGNSRSLNAYCAWHSSTSTSHGTIAFTNFPYQYDAGASCGEGSVNSPGTLDGVSIVGGHEQAETETDPQPNSGWLDSSGAEIGDKCAWTNLQNTSFSTGTFPTQPLWSNAANGCVQ
ncbi:MAG TPA: hypothetical protein VGZ02_02090 [Candidatus Baltobacteraceae bacterium]|jgi:serine protease|nr:hypothetical protein [Candidatus Baltobacteraceae bacterium]